MNLGKLGKQIKREALRSPKKAAFLGSLVLVAAYFWAPLVMEWCGGSGVKTTANNVKMKPPVPAPGAAVPSPVPGVAGVSPKTKEPAKQQPWNVLVRWMEEDPRARPAASVSEKFNPFIEPTAAEMVDRPKAVVKAVEPKPAPTSMNVVLTGTIVGPKHSVAQINGRTYAVGKPVPVGAFEGKPFYFTLVEVRPKSVVLERLGKWYVVPLQTYEQAGGNAVVKNSP